MTARCAAFMLAVVLVGCHADTIHHGTTRELTSRPWTDGLRVYVPVFREHYTERTYRRVFFKQDTETDRSVDRVDHLGYVIVDLGTDECTRSKSAGRRLAPQPAWVVPTPVPTAPSSWTPSARRVFARGGTIFTVDASGQERELLRIQGTASGWIAGTDAILINGQLVDAATGSSWQVPMGIVQRGDRWFVPSSDRGILELGVAPIVERARHMPPVPNDHGPILWLARTEWPTGATFGDTTLLKLGEQLVLEHVPKSGTAGRWRILMTGSGPVYRFEATGVAVQDGFVVDLNQRTSRKTTGTPRVGRLGDRVVVEDALPPELTKTPYLELLGFDGERFIFNAPSRRELMIFDAGSRTWQLHSYDRCIDAPDRRGWQPASAGG